MKRSIEKREPTGLVDYIALALTTFGVGYIPGAPGTYGSIIGVGIYIGVGWWIDTLRRSDCIGSICDPSALSINAAISVLLVLFILIGIWASSRSEAIFGSGDPSQAVVDEVQGQLITFVFIPFTLDWRLILAGFLLFRLFDILKPYPANVLQNLPGGLGICADDIVAGVYAGICLAVGYAVYWWI